MLKLFIVGISKSEGGL